MIILFRALLRSLSRLIRMRCYREYHRSIRVDLYRYLATEPVFQAASFPHGATCESANFDGALCVGGNCITPSDDFHRRDQIRIPYRYYSKLLLDVQTVIDYLTSKRLLANIDL